jgi:hypothetical protein
MSRRELANKETTCSQTWASSFLVALRSDPPRYFELRATAGLVLIELQELARYCVPCLHPLVWHQSATLRCHSGLMALAEDSFFVVAERPSRAWKVAAAAS